MKNSNVETAFRMKPIAVGCAVLIATGLHPALAQQSTVAVAENGQPIQSVTVTGIRRGIEAAISVKRNNDSIVEAISSEDIGKLPDQSIAESIARLPGVATQRTGGRASAISIRGMSPDFSTALLNGREQVSTGDSRGVEFDQYPAELLSGVVIYKTPDGALVGQGLSGTVDLQTVRPLDFAGRAVALNYRREKNGVGTDGRGDGDRFSISYIDQFAERKVGVALGFARLKGTSGAISRFEGWGNGDDTYNGATVNVPYNGFGAWTDQQEQTRDGLMGVLQLRPNRDFTSTLDVFYSEYDRRNRTRGLQAPLRDNPGADNLYDAPGRLSTAVLSGNNVTSGTYTNVHAVIRNDVEKTLDKTTSLGWNTRYRATPDWTLSADLSYNTAKRNGRAVETYAGTAQGTPYDTFGFTAGSQQFKPGLDYTNRSIIRLTDVQGWGGADIQAGYTRAPVVDDKIKALRLSAKRDLPEGLFFSNVEVGANLSDRSKRREFTEAVMSVGGSNRMAAIAMPGAETGRVANTGISVATFDPIEHLSLYTQTQKLHPDIYNKDWFVKEKVLTAFSKLNIDSTLFGLPLHGAVGLQFLRTEQESTAYSVDTSGGTSNANRPVSNFTDGQNYTDVLPSANFILDLPDQQALRLSVSKIMARPTMNDMRASNSVSVNTTRGIYSGSGGNPRLDPFRAKGLDLSYERYWDRRAYISLAGFYKKLDTYVVSRTLPYDFSALVTPSMQRLPSNIGEYTSPVNGNGGSIKGLESTASFPLGMATSYLDGFGVIVNASVTSSSLNVPDTTNGGSGNMPLPGLSRKVGSLTLYYEKHGFSARVANRYRSSFIGEINEFDGDRQATYIRGDSTVDLQLGYEFRSGPLKNLSFNLSVNNLNDAPFIRYRRTVDNVIENVSYGKTVLFGVNYRL